MATELKTRKYSKEQMIAYLEKHGSTLTEAANIAGTNTRTLGRYLADGVIPSEWYAKITAALKDRKPGVKETADNVKICSACKKPIPKSQNAYNIDANLLKEIGATVPTSGWHWYTKPKTGEKAKMYPVCEKCYLKAVPAKRKNAVKGKIVIKKN